MATKGIGLDKIVDHLSVTTPFSYFEIDFLMTKCRTYYHPVEKAVGKCVIVIESAQEFGISLDESLTLQKVIDFELL